VEWHEISNHAEKSDLVFLQVVVVIVLPREAIERLYVTGVARAQAIRIGSPGVFSGMEA
jgi:hypothetical protein